ncbi:glycerate kinase type-2 family protein [Halopiger goleimassiliensis]|uniref:glycerate kinase type-2 family protein n=1 Tax=Halopiger goleimassiliensis TaxID=1293048 RepID=UPI000677C2AB|nr:DUF4147 domain-containing protein [Halopiger goleimassiliensis]
MEPVTVPNRDALQATPAHAVALDCLVSGIEAAHPRRLVEERVSVRDDTLRIETVDGNSTAYDLERYDDVVVVGGGNAVRGFARALEDALDDRLTGGAVVTDDLAATVEDGVSDESDERIEVLPGEHPVPTETNVRNTRRLLEVAADVSADDLVVAVVTGGASALLTAPAQPLSLANLRSTTEALLGSGAPIDEINAVRKHCSAIKGGRLAETLAPATVCALVLSDVVGDDPSVIGSGPTVPDPSTYADARAVLERYDLEVPDAVERLLTDGSTGDRPETPTADDSAFDRVTTHVVGSNRTALEAARETASERGYEPLVLSSRVRGEAREAALTHVAIAEECRETATPIEPPAVLLSGGETTVALGPSAGEGGPNQEFVTAATLALEADRVVVSSVDTDGIDGSTDAAGAIAAGSTLDPASARDALDRNDVEPLLATAGALVRTGPTGTNVNDLRVIVVE